MCRLSEGDPKSLPAAPRLRASRMAELPNHWPPLGSSAPPSFKRNKIKLIWQKCDEAFRLVDIHLDDPDIGVLTLPALKII